MGDPTPWCVMRTKRGFFSGWGWSIWRRNDIVLLSRKVGGKRGMGDHGGETTANGRFHWEEGAQVVRVGWGETYFGKIVRGSGEETEEQRQKFS